VVIQFQRLYFKIWISVDSGTGFSDLDDKKRKKELEISGNGQPFILNDPDIKEGKMGFFSS